METETLEDSEFRKSEKKRIRFDEMRRELSPEDYRRTKWHGIHDRMLDV